MSAYVSRHGVVFYDYAPSGVEVFTLSEEQELQYATLFPNVRVEITQDGVVSVLVDDPDYTPPLTPDQERDLLLAQLQEDNKVLRAQLSASIQSKQTLEDCLVEMASVVYA